MSTLGPLTFHITHEPDLGTWPLDCPACGVRGVPARVYEQRDRVKLAFLIPLLELRNTHFVCSRCESSIPCDVPFERAKGLDREAFAQALRWHPSAAAKVAALLGLLVCLVPFGGLAVCLGAWYLARGTRGWPLAAAITGTILAATVSLSLAVVLTYPYWRRL